MIVAYLVLIETNILITDRFVVKTPSASSQEKKKITPLSKYFGKRQGKKVPEGTFHVDDGLLFTLRAVSPSIVLDVLLFVQHSG